MLANIKNAIVHKAPEMLLRLVLLAAISSAPLYLVLQNFAFFEPYFYPLHVLQKDMRQITPNIIVGHYPDHSLLANLHQEGYTTVISLLDPQLSYEQSLIEREELFARQIGMTVYNHPMDSNQPPSSPMNAAALSQIRKFVADHPDSKIYIHCYLGKHRVNNVARMLTANQTAPANNQ